MFRNLTFELSPSMLISLKGMNGSGKSTLLKTLAGLCEPSKGTFAWYDKTITLQDPLWLSQVLYIGHKIGVQSSLTPVENLKWYFTTHFFNHKKILKSRLFSTSIDQAFLQLELQKVQNIPCGFLSKGQQQRVALARLWVQPAKIWILDEPLTSLDGKGQAVFQKQLMNHLSLGGMAIMASHQTLEVGQHPHVELNIQDFHSC